MDVDWKVIVRTVAPMLGTAFGGPLGGMAVNAVAAAILGPGVEATEENIGAALQNLTPEMRLALKDAERVFIIEMQQLGIEATRLGNEDRANARHREIATSDWTPRVMALIFVVGFFVTQCFVFTQPLPAGNEMIIAQALGTLNAAVLFIFGYYYGTTQGNARAKERAV